MLNKALTLVADSPWGTSPTEQLHASAIFSRWHKEFGPESLILRAGLRSFARLLPMESRLDRHEKKLMARIATLEQTNPKHLTGRQLYLRELHALAATWERTTGRPMPHNLSMLVMRRHEAKWQALSSQQRQGWDLRSSVSRSGSRHNIDSALDVTRASLVDVRSKKAEATQNHPPLSLDSCKVSGADEAVLKEIMTVGAIASQKAVTSLRSKLMTPPDILPLHRRQEIANAVVVKGGKHNGMHKPSWLPQICRNRDALKSAVVILRPASGAPARHYKFLFAKKTPQSASFSPFDTFSRAPMHSYHYWCELRGGVHGVLGCAV